MLVLTRKKGQSIIIQENIEITILSVEGDIVKVGINAPKNVDIFREEVYLSVKEANKESAAPAPDTLNALIERLRTKKNFDKSSNQL